MTGKSRPKPCRPVPDDFAQWALDKTRDQIRVRYSCGTGPAHRWLDAMPEEWRLERAAHFNARLISAGKKIQAIGTRAFVDKRRAIMPHDFVEQACAMTQIALALHYGISSGAVHRLLLKLSDDDRAKIKAAGKARISEASARNALKAGAKSKQVRVAKERAPKKAKTPGKASGKNWGFTRAPDLAPLCGSEVAMAAQHLRTVERHVAPICAATVVLGKSGEGFYKYGTRLVPEAFIIERAREKGWAGA